MKTGTSCSACSGAGRLTPVGATLVQCSSCRYVFGRPFLERADCREVSIDEIARIAPSGVLRDRYHIQYLLGRGAHGIAYLAEHQHLRHPVVVKVLPHRVQLTSEAAAERLRGEARAGFRVNDAHVVRVLDCDVSEGVWYFVMEHVDGADLQDVIAAHIDVAWRQAADFAIDAASGLAAIHRDGLIHRDIKPSNLLVDLEGHVRIADLGVAGMADAETGTSSEPHATSGGTLDYAAPEMLAADVPAGAAADIYSLGATLYHLLVGRPPHASKGVFATLLSSQFQPASWPSDCRKDVPKWLVSTILRCLGKEARDRFASAQELLDHIKQHRGGTTDALVPASRTALEPRGVAVLPFENIGSDPADGWIGFAVADFLGQRLSALPGVYATDRDQLIRKIDELRKVEPDGGRRLDEAARLVGAATVISGECRRTASSVHLTATLHHVGDATPPTKIGQAEGPMSDLLSLQNRLLSDIAEALEVGDARSSDTRVAPACAVSPRAQEAYVRGRQAYLRGDYAAAVQHAEEAASIDPQYAEPLGFAGACHARLGDYDKAATWHRKLEALADERGDERLRVEVLANLGMMHFFKGEYVEARGFCSQAAETAQRVGLLAELAQIQNNLGFVLMRLGETNEAETAFRQAISTHEAYGALVSLVAPYNGLGNVLLEQKRYGEARRHHEQALAWAHQIGDRAKIGVSHMNVGRCAALEGDFTTAKHEFTMAVNALEETSFWNGLTRAYEYIADMHIELKNFEDAIRFANRRIELAGQHSNRSMEAAAWRQKAKALELMGHTEQAEACRRKTEQVLNADTE